MSSAMSDTGILPLEHADIETSSADYARRFAGEVGRWFLAVQEAATLELLRPHPGASVLDVGGGHGQLTGALVAHGYRVTVFASAEVCRTRIQDFIDSGRCQFQVGDILQLPYPDRSFDVVVSYRLLPHVTRYAAFLAQLGRVAKEAVIIDCPTVRSLNVLTPLLFPMKRRIEQNTRPYTLFRESAIAGELRAAGFVKVARRPQFFWPMAIHRALGQVTLSRALEAATRWTGLTALFGSPVILKLARPGGRS
jgi:ubiquinone/menaquinone biosynthesis C-methylase UbiE